MDEGESQIAEGTHPEEQTWDADENDFLHRRQSRTLREVLTAPCPCTKASKRCGLVEKESETSSGKPPPDSFFQSCER